MNARAGLAALLAGALSLAALAAPAQSVDPACGALGASRAVQDDALSGRDAGDERGGGVELLHDDYVWGFLDLQPDNGAADVGDWYYADVPAGPPDREVTIGIVALPAVGTETPDGLYPPAPLFHLTFWVPGEPGPRATNSATTNITLDTGAAGRYWFHAWVEPAAGVPVCAAAGSVPHLADLPEQANDYGVYFGCEPFCLMGPVQG